MGNCQYSERIPYQKRQCSHAHTQCSTICSKKQLGHYTENDVDDILGNQKDFCSFDVSKKIVSDFQIIKKIGQGNFGKVYHVHCPSDKKDYAMKVILKSRIKSDRQRQHIINERNILASNNHPFLLKLYYSFQDEKKLYLITEYIQGGDLYLNMKYKQRFTHREVQFYCSEIIVALEYLHSKGVIYRDLKPENILLTKQGHIKLADFGLSKIKTFREERSQSQCGTPDYIAPEIVFGKDHNESVDFWSLGSVIYELYHGNPPFFSKDKAKQIHDSMNKEVLISKQINQDAQDLIRRLLQPDPNNRIGKNGLQEIKSHPYFATVDWDKVEKCQIEPVKPIKPEAVKKEIELLNALEKSQQLEGEINQNDNYEFKSVHGYSFNFNQNQVILTDQRKHSDIFTKASNTDSIHIEDIKNYQLFAKLQEKLLIEQPTC